MTSAKTLDCRAVAAKFLEAAAAELKALPFAPVLAVVRRGHDPAVRAYERLLAADAEGAGVRVESVEAATEAELAREIGRLNADPGIHGILLMAPLRGEVPDSEYANRVDPAKDVEGRHAVNLGYLYQYKRFLDEARGVKCVVPATAKAVVKLLAHHGLPGPGAFAAIMNDSEVVGRPLGMMLKNLGATVVNCHVGTRPDILRECAGLADILVTAVPDPSFRLEAGWIKPGAAVVDLSYAGNVDHAAVAERAALLTPAKGGAGVGRVTRAMLFVNLSYCCRRAMVERMAASVESGT